MSIRPLPSNANLQNLKKQAKSLLKAIKSNEAASIARIKPYFSNLDTIGLQDAQLALARDYGFSSWNKLVIHVESDQANDQLSQDQIANDFLRHVVLVYSETETADPQRFSYAADILEQHPDLSSDSIYVASAAGDTQMVKHWLSKDASLINRKGGFHRWEPLMYAAYSRLANADTLAVAQELINNGADPNAHYMWGGQYRFTALTGVFGQGEGGPINLPEHPQCHAFARLLLSAGANPNDSQVAYNRMFENDNDYLQLLLEFGLTDKEKNNWLLQVNGELIEHPDATLRYQLNYAIANGRTDRVRLLLEGGVSLDYEEQGRSPYQLACIAEQTEIADLLVEHGATSAPLATIDQLKKALLNGDRQQVEQLIDHEPDLKPKVLSTFPHLIEKAVDLNRSDSIRLLCEFGFDVNHIAGRTALHQAAWLGNIELIKLLIELGANSSIREPNYLAPPIGWAIHNDKQEAVDYLDTQKMDIVTASARGLVGQAKRLLDAEPTLLNTTFADIRPRESQSVENDWMTPLAFAIVNNQIGMANFLLKRNASVQVSNGQGVSIVSLARELGNTAIINSVNQRLDAGNT